MLKNGSLLIVYKNEIISLEMNLEMKEVHPFSMDYILHNVLEDTTILRCIFVVVVVDVLDSRNDLQGSILDSWS